jgi:hypothetical protein
MTIERITSNRWQGLSTDTKPTTGVIANSTFRETNTNTDWIYDGTLWSLKDVWVGPFSKKQGAHYPRGNISTSTGGLLGGLNTSILVGAGPPTVTGTLMDANGCGCQIDTSATINNIGGWKTTSFTCRLYNCIATYRFLLTQTTDCRIFMGFSSGSGSNPASNSDYLNALSGAGLWFDSGVSANWKFMHNDGSGASTIVDTTQGADTLIHTVSIIAKDSVPNFIIQLDGVTMTNGTATTDLPASSTSMGTVIYIENIAAASKTLKYYKLFVQSDL